MGERAGAEESSHRPECYNALLDEFSTFRVRTGLAGAAPPGGLPRLPYVRHSVEWDGPARLPAWPPYRGGPDQI